MSAGGRQRLFDALFPSRIDLGAPDRRVFSCLFEITFLPLHFKVNNLFLRKELQRLSSSSGEFGAATKKRRRRRTRHRAAQERKSRFLSLREGGARGDFGLHAPAPASRGKLRQQHTRRTRPHSRLTRLRLWLQLGPGRAQLCSV